MIIKIDIDQLKINQDDFDFKLKTLMRIRKLKTCKVDIYNTNKGFHIYIKADGELPALECLFWQIVLGSDPYRELFNYKRILNQNLNGEYWNVLFQLKKQGDIFVSKETFNKSYEVICNDKETNK